MAHAQVRKTEMRFDYVNVPKAPHRRSPPVSTDDKKLLRWLVLSFGLLCMIQATLNVSLRIFLYSSAKTTELEGSCNNQTEQKMNNLDQYFRDGWLLFGPNLYFISTTKKNWQDSRQDCLRRGADLIVINSQEEQEFMRRFHRFIWIGLQNPNSQKFGTWTWVDGTPLTLSFWGTNEPTSENEEKCVESRFFETLNTWNDRTCDFQTEWICEKTTVL